MPSITLKGISKHICKDIDLHIEDKELLVFLGPNGAGKTTLINVIAGLIDYIGTVSFDGKAVDTLPTCQRQIGYMFQDLALFPHLTVADNIAYGLKIQKKEIHKIQERVQELLQTLKIAHLASRFPKNLSGGEKQRVALARALAPLPEVLLLDEPLSSLDIQTSKNLRIDLRQLQRKFGITTVYVTHDLQEAEEMADRIAVIQDGKIEQIGKPEQVFFYPENERVLDFIGAPNILDCDECRSIGHGMMEVSCGGLSVLIPHDGSNVQRVAIFPRDIYIYESKPPGPEVNRFKAMITDINTSGEMVRIKLKVGKTILHTEIPHYKFADMNLERDKEVFLILKLRRMRIYENGYLPEVNN